MTTTRKLSAALVGAVVAGLLAALALLSLAGAKHTATTVHTATVTAAPVSVTHTVARKTTGCTKPAPTSAAGYNSMFAHVDPKLWGGADTAISVHLANGLVVWLYSDTISTGRFVHSSAIVQDKGCLTVVNGGAQIFPNENSKLIYWVDSAHAISSNAVSVRLQQVKIGTAGTWDFHATGLYRTAVLTVSNPHTVAVSMQSTDRKNATKFPYTKNVVDCSVKHNGKRLSYPTARQLCPGSGEYSYNPQTHTAKLASGKVLLSVCFNNADALTHFDHYRPKFFEVTS